MIRIPEVVIRILIPEYVFKSEKVNFGLTIRIPDVAIRILDVECVSGSEKVNFGLPIRIPDEAIRIPDVAIWIQIPESFLNSEKWKMV